MWCQCRNYGLIRFASKPKQLAFNQNWLNRSQFNGWLWGNFFFFLINWAVVKAFHIHGNYPAWSCLILCMLLILEHAMECSSFDLLVLRAYILFNFFEFPVRMCTIFKKRTAVKEPFDITENSVLFCRYWLKDPFCLW